MEHYTRHVRRGNVPDLGQFLRSFHNVEAQYLEAISQPFTELVVSIYYYLERLKVLENGNQDAADNYYYGSAN